MLDRLPVLLALGAFGVCAVALVWGRPAVLSSLWLLSVAFVPVWVGVSVGIGLEPATYAGLPVAALLLVSCRPRQHTPLTVLDLLVLIVFALCLISGAFGSLSTEESTRIVLKWALGYVLGRLMLARVEPNRLYAIIGVVMGVAAVLGVVEFLTSTNPFFALHGPDGASAYRVWAQPQIRGGLWRAEGAFGHSIAFGCSLAFALTLLVCARLPARVTAVLSVAMGAAIVVCFSRLGIIVALIGLLLTVLSPRSPVSRAWRVTVLSALGAAAVVVAPFLSAVFGDAGSEASDSADYRDRLWALVPTVQVLGKSGAAYVGPSGTPYFGSFRSIDNAVLLLALTYGALPLVLLGVLYLGGVVRLLRGRFEAPVAGMVALLPALLSVALITQFETFVWFGVGLACAAVSQDAARRTRSMRAASPDPHVGPIGQNTSVEHSDALVGSANRSANAAAEG